MASRHVKHVLAALCSAVGGELLAANQVKWAQMLMGRCTAFDSQRGSVTLSCNAKPGQQARGGDMRLLEKSSEGNGDIDLEREDADRLL